MEKEIKKNILLTIAFLSVASISAVQEVYPGKIIQSVSAESGSQNEYKHEYFAVDSLVLPSLVRQDVEANAKNSHTYITQKTTPSHLEGGSPTIELRVASNVKIGTKFSIYNKESYLNEKKPVLLLFGTYEVVKK
ncbi:MAG: hypothetical protein ACJAZS_000463 [Alteromonas naphthalenivorans]|jgi:hypothetical protein